MRTTLPRVIGLWLAAGLVLAPGSRGQTLEAFELKGDRLSLTAEKAPLTDVLQAFRKQGVRVKIDPSVQTRISAQMRDREVEQFLREYVSPHSFVCVWNRTPEGGIRLAEIQIFRPGHEREVQVLADPVLKVVGGGPGDRLPAHVDGEIIISLRDRARAGAVTAWVARLGGQVVETALDGLVLRLRFPPGTDLADVFRRMRRMDDITLAEPNYAHKLPGGRMIPPEGAAADAEDVAPDAAAERAGGAPVAVLDSGFSPLEGYAVPVTGAYNALDPASSAADPVGHGTQMALLASGAVLPLGMEGAGLGPTPVLAIRAFDANGVTSNFDLFRAIDAAAQNGARVISLSWGTETQSQFLAQAIRLAQDKGLVVVAAAGNEATGRPVYPAAFPGVIAVSAATPTGTRWDSANYGDFVDFAAPGFARLPVGYQGPPGLYAGTSAATAFTAGLVARYLAAHPDATPELVVKALEAAASEAGAAGRDKEFGAGLLDDAALKKLFP